MRRLHLTLAAPILFAVAAPAAIPQPLDPLRFFEGRTQSDATVKVLFHKAYRGHSIGVGRIETDGSLTLVQHVADEGQPPHDRRWHIGKVGPGRYAGTMSDASGPVAIDQVGEQYRFRFIAKDRYSVEEWLSPLPGGRSAHNSIQVRRFGMVVASTDGIIRKI